MTETETRLNNMQCGSIETINEHRCYRSTIYGWSVDGHYYDRLDAAAEAARPPRVPVRTRIAAWFTSNGVK